MILQKAPLHLSPGRSICLLPALVSMVLLVACAAQTPSPKPIRQCDPAADEAVAQGDWELARKTHERLLASEPGNCLALYHLGYIWGQLGNRASEIHFYEAAITCGYTDDDQLYFNLGMAYADQGDTERAVKALNRATQLDPDNPDNFFGLGVTNQLAGREAEAEAVLLATLRLDSTHTEARLSLIRLYLNQSRWEDARRQLRQIKVGDPGYEAARELWQTLESREAEEYKGRNPH